RNRFDDVVSPQAKVMIFERRDFTRKDRPARLGGRESFRPNWNNPEATSRFALVDGSVDSVRMSKLYGLIAPGARQADIDAYTPSGSWTMPDRILGDPSDLQNPGMNHDGLENGDGSALGIPGGFSAY